MIESGSLPASRYPMNCYLAPDFAQMLQKCRVMEGIYVIYILKLKFLAGNVLLTRFALGSSMKIT